MTVPAAGRGWWNRINAPLAASVLSTLICLGAYTCHHNRIVPLPGLDQLEHITIDTRFDLRGPLAPSTDEIVIVALDDKTYDELPEVFFRRRGWARLVDAVASQRPRSIAIDSYFRSRETNLSETLITKVRHVIEVLGDETERSVASEAALSTLREVDQETRSDEILADAIGRAGNVHLGVLFFLGRGASLPGAPQPPDLALAAVDEGVVVDGSSRKRPPIAYAASGSFHDIASRVAGAGFINTSLDKGGVIRRAPLVINYDQRLYLGLGLSVARAVLGKDGAVTAVSGKRHIRLGNRELPVDRRGRAFLNHLGPGGIFPRVSAADVIEGRTAGDALAGKIVFIGFTDASRDKVRTPFDSAFDGVEIHATVLQNALDGSFLRPATGLWTALSIILLGALLTVVQIRRIRRERSWITGIAALLLIAACLVAAHVLFESNGIVLEVAAPILATLSTALASMTTGLFTEGREKSFLRSALAQYVEAQVVDDILADPSKIRLGGERRDLTVLFSDIRNFSTFAEGLEPEELNHLLNEFLTPMTRVVLEQGGMVDKYIGDAIMAVFGAPLPAKDHAERACATALAMVKALEALNTSWADRNWPDISTGIGINSGPMAVGNMGSDTRFDYTVIGDAVNLGSRLEALTREYRVQIIVGQGTYEQAKESYTFRALDWVRVKGREGVCTIYELVGPADGPKMWVDDLAIYQNALSAYRDGDWDQAHKGFDLFLGKHPGDGPSTIMKRRIEQIRNGPRSASWDGVFDQRKK